jgi:hypothetical protein
VSSVLKKIMRTDDKPRHMVGGITVRTASKMEVMVFYALSFRFLSSGLLPQVQPPPDFEGQASP